MPLSLKWHERQAKTKDIIDTLGLPLFHVAKETSQGRNTDRLTAAAPPLQVA